MLAYAFLPGMGSEPGAGWVWTRILAGIGEVWVIGRPWSTRPGWIEQRLAEVPEGPAIHPVALDMPRWWYRLWSRVEHSRRPAQVEYLVWMLYALRLARRLHRQHRFDLVWHVTWANAWLGSTGGLVGPPFVYGPVGGGVSPPWRLVPALGLRGAALEVLRAGARLTARHLNPFARLAWSRASLILAQNPETRDWLPRSCRDRTIVAHNAVLEEVVTPRSTPAPARTALFAGRLVPWKGASLAIETIAELPEWELLICGDGPDRQRLDDLARRLSVTDRVTFLGPIDRDEVLRLLRSRASVFLFPSLHDDAPLAVAEAIASGVPVVCLDRGGPPTIGGHGVAVGDHRTTVRRLAAAVRATAGVLPSPRQPLDITGRRRDVVALLEGRPLGSIRRASQAGLARD